VRACVRACVRARVCVYVGECARVRTCIHACVSKMKTYWKMF